MTTSQQHFRSFHRDHRLVPLSHPLTPRPRPHRQPPLPPPPLRASCASRSALAGGDCSPSSRCRCPSSSARSSRRSCRPCDSLGSTTSCSCRRSGMVGCRVPAAASYGQGAPSPAALGPASSCASRMQCERRESRAAGKLEEEQVSKVRRCIHGRPSLQRVEQNPSSIASSMSSSTSSFMCLRSGV